VSDLESSFASDSFKEREKCNHNMVYSQSAQSIPMVQGTGRERVMLSNVLLTFNSPADRQTDRGKRERERERQTDREIEDGGRERDRQTDSRERGEIVNYIYS